MEELKKEMLEIIKNCDNKELVEYLYKWVVYSVIYYQQEKR